MFGFRDEFEYFQCSKCNCLQISQPPEDLSKYYPKKYYSFSFSADKISLFKYLLMKLRNNYLIFNKGIIGKLLYNKYPVEKCLFYDQLLLLKRLPFNKKSRILDVGCGSGKLLYNLSISSLRNLLGIDPFIQNNIIYNNKLNIFKKNISNVTGEWDIIMFNHSFEHLPDPVESLLSVSKLLAKGGFCLLRLPIVSSFAWEHYRENWVQLDAPRHFFLHSIESIRNLGEIANCELIDTIYDSTAFQFWGSEQYKKDIPLKSDKSLSLNPSNCIFSKDDIKGFSDKAKQLNKDKRGDQAAFYLMKR
jgi:SAM-dependent methyltransferase